jgi:hypothetical protein
MSGTRPRHYNGKAPTPIDPMLVNVALTVNPPKALSVSYYRYYSTDNPTGTRRAIRYQPMGPADQRR